MKNYYELLEINENASQEVIERVYKLFAKKYHPDLNPDNKEEAENKFKEITEAYEVLVDENKRRAYDSKLKAELEKKYKNSSTQTNTNNTNQYSERQSYYEPRNTSSSNEEYYSQTIERQQEDIENLKAYNEALAQDMAQRQAEREHQIKKAYTDAYYEALQNMGVKVVYKKTFKEKVATIVRVLIFLIIMVVILLILWQIPDVRDKFNNVTSLFRQFK